jgi:hypothetical protein
MPKIESPTHGSFISMKKRCYEKGNKNYKYYGGRGITVCERWKYYENFLADMGNRPFGKTLDRIDVDKGYFKENCRWATPKQQVDNRRPYECSWEYKGEKKSKEEWSKITGINYWTLRERIETRGWSTEKAFTTPVKPKAVNREYKILKDSRRETGGLNSGAL